MSEAENVWTGKKCSSSAWILKKPDATAQKAKPEKEDTCSMCGNFCAVKNTNRILDGEIVTIFDE